MSCGVKTILMMMISIAFSNCDNTYMKMTIVWGYPEVTASQPENVSTTWDECVLQCYQEDSCVLVHKTSIGCDLYKFSSISSARNPSQEDNGGDKIAFKTMLSTDTCPVAPFDNSSTYSYQNGDRFVYSITTTYSEDSNNDNIISFNYTTLQCPIGSKIFARESLWVCLSVQYFTNELPYQYCANHSRASVLCKNSGGTLTGPANTAEYNYFKNVSVSTSEIAPYSSSVVCIWLDGNSINVTREFVMEDSTHNGDTAYPFSSPNPNSDAPGSCLYFSSFPNPVVDDYFCYVNYIQSPSEACLRGAACRLEIMTT